MTQKTPLILLKNITKSYPLGDTSYQALRGVSLAINTGEFVAIMGPSGSGKSTLMYILGGLDTPTSGEYRLHDSNISDYTDDQLAEIRNREIGFVFQAFNLLPRTTVMNNVQRPMSYAKRISPAERYDRAMEMLKLVHLEDKADNLSNQLSGGQIQRVAIARALVMNPSLILADEPTGNLDSKTSLEVLAFFRDLHKQGRTIVLITHSDEIAQFAERIIRVKDGVVESDKKTINMVRP
jgi:putative ABC transport system ATP-binding protein